MDTCMQKCLRMGHFSWLMEKKRTFCWRLFVGQTTYIVFHGTLREEPIQINVILQHKLWATQLSAVYTV